jgi:hypothetical protein
VATNPRSLVTDPGAIQPKPLKAHTDVEGKSDERLSLLERLDVAQSGINKPNRRSREKPSAKGNRPDAQGKGFRRRREMRPSFKGKRSLLSRENPAVCRRSDLVVLDGPKAFTSTGSHGIPVSSRAAASVCCSLKGRCRAPVRHRLSVRDGPHAGVALTEFPPAAENLLVFPRSTAPPRAPSLASRRHRDDQAT